MKDYLIAHADNIGNGLLVVILMLLAALGGRRGRASTSNAVEVAGALIDTKQFAALADAVGLLTVATVDLKRAVEKGTASAEEAKEEQERLRDDIRRLGDALLMTAPRGR